MKKEVRVGLRAIPEFEHLEQRVLLSSGWEVDAQAIQDLQGGGGEIVRLSWGDTDALARADEWIVRFAGSTGSAADSISQAALGWEFEVGFESLAAGGFGLLKAPLTQFESIYKWAAANEDVLYVEPNFLYSTDQTIPDDSKFNFLWGLHNTGQAGGTADADIDAPEAWDITTGSSNIVVAIIDTGADLDHKDLLANIWTNAGEIAGDGIDNDSNGFIDDVNGWDFADDDNDPNDINGHGTHVAGTIGAVGNNNQGVVGVNWNVSLMPLRFIDASGFGTTADAIDAIQYVTTAKTTYGVNVVAINASWGGGGYSAALKDAIETAGDAGILFVAAAGNDADDTDVTPHWPSSYDLDNIISVAATDRDDDRASFSSYGAVSVDLAAPGVNIQSTKPNNRYGSMQGTSMSAPHVAGAVALLAAADPTASSWQIKGAILSGADPIPAMAGISTTGGRLNVYQAIQALSTPGPLVLSVVPTASSPPTDQIEIFFSEAIEPASVVGENFLLRSDGADDIFDTGDDVVIPIATSDLTQPTSQRVLITLDSDLPLEQYRLTLLGTGASPIRNLLDEPLNAGSDEVREFEIVAVTGPFEPNDSMGEATDSGIVGGGSDVFTGYLGDGYYALLDVDLFVLEAGAGATIIADINANETGSPLDAVLRIFDASGNEIAINDDTTGLDPYIELVDVSAGTYYVGVSGYDNYFYDPTVPGSGGGGSVGDYDLVLTVPAPSEIHGSKWEDSDADGVWDAGEPPLAGWKIYIDENENGQWDATEPYEITDANGDYSFVGIDPGTYTIGEEPQAGWTQTYPGTAGPTSQSVSSQPPSSSEQQIDYALPEMMITDSAPIPPIGVDDYIMEEIPLSGVMLGEVPTSSWTYGSSPTAAGMIFGYYDRTGYPNMYTGPTNGGVAPLEHLGQGMSATPIPGSISIIATQNGFDGRTTNGHVDDYWISSSSQGPDPWEGNWTEHPWEGNTADFMGTNQWKWDYDPWGSPDGTIDSNVDSGTVFFYNTDGSVLYDYVPPASTGFPRTALSHGLRLFAESRGYIVLENYTQQTDNQSPTGFTFADYMAEIDAGYPVMIQVTSHTMVGVGYDAATETVYLHDTWGDYVTSMTWGGSYSGLDLQAVTVIHLEGGSVPGAHTVVVGSGQSVENIDFGNLHIEVVATNVFYNNSAWDGNDPAANSSDDNAIDLSKSALLPGGTGTFANYISYVRGINGIMIDIAGPTGVPTGSDFEIKVGNDNDPSAWASGPVPTSVTVRAGAGVGISDRITLIFSDTDAYNSQWMQITVLATAETGLADPDVFYYGLAIGETGNSATDAYVNASDRLGCRENPHSGFDPASVDDVYDFNRDRNVNATDRLIARSHATSGFDALSLITVPDQQGASSQSAPASLPGSAIAVTLAGEKPFSIPVRASSLSPAVPPLSAPLSDEDGLLGPAAPLSEPFAGTVSPVASANVQPAQPTRNPLLPLPLDTDSLQIDLLSTVAQTV